MLGHILHRGTVVLCDIAVGTDILKQFFHSGLGQVDAVTGFHVAALGITGGGIFEDFCAVQELPVVFLAHFHQRFVVLIHLGLGQILVGMHLAQRRDGVDDDIHAGIGFHNALDAFLVIFHKTIRRVIRAQIVGTEGQNHALGLHQGNRFGHGNVVGIPLQLHTGIGCQRLGAHAHRADGIVVGAIVKHTVHTRRIAVPQEQCFIHVVLPGVLAFLQNRGRILCLVNGILVLIVAALGNQRLTFRCRFAVGIAAEKVHAPHQNKGNRHTDQQHQTAQAHDNVHFTAGIQRLLFGCFFLCFACHCGSFRAKKMLYLLFLYIRCLLYTIFRANASLFSIFTYFSSGQAHKKCSPPAAKSRKRIQTFLGRRWARCKAGSSTR